MKTLSELMAEHGIYGLSTLRIAENKFVDDSYTIGYAFKDGKWVVYRTESRNIPIVTDSFDTEQEAIDELFKLIKAYHHFGQ